MLLLVAGAVAAGVVVVWALPVVVRGQTASSGTG